MMSLLLTMLAALPSVCAQELDPDTLALPATANWLDGLMLDAMPGSSLLVRTEPQTGLVSLRALAEHPMYRIGVLRPAATDEPPLWWVLVRHGPYAAGAGDITAESGLGTILSAFRGLGRSRIAPAGSDVQRVRGGAGGVQGITASLQIDTSMAVTMMAGGTGPGGDDLVAVWSDVRYHGIASTITMLLHGSADDPHLALAVAARKRFAPSEAGIELAIDGGRRPAMQAFFAARRASMSASLSLWYADAGCELPLGSILATAERTDNTWGAMLRVRSTQRGVVTARCSATLFGRPWRTRLLPMASTGFELIADIEQRVTHRLLVGWRFSHRHDQDGQTVEQRRQVNRRNWSGRIRMRRIISPVLELRANIDLRAVRLGLDPWQRGSFGWVDMRWQASSATTVRLRAGVFASPSADVAVTTVEYASRGLQTMVRGLGWGRRLSMGVEWTLGSMMVVALQACVESAVRDATHTSDASLRVAASIRIDAEQDATTVASPEDDMREPRE